ncbi:MAG: hypothetical protein AAFY30_04025 [Cyanobacteria bacterium J06642_12]
MRFTSGHPSLKPIVGLSILVVLLAVDFFFLAFHLLRETNVLSLSDVWSIARDSSYAEWFQYVKLGYVAIASFYLYSLFRRWFYCAFGVLFTLILADDALVLHEGIGQSLAASLNVSEPVAEVLFVGFACLPPLLFILYEFVRFRSIYERKFAFEMIVALSVFALLGVGLDFVGDQFSEEASSTRAILDAIEDFGEMVVLSAIVWLTYRNTQMLDWSKPKAIWMDKAQLLE